MLTAQALSAVSAAFLASLVEVVEAFTIVLAASVVRGWRPALVGAALGLGFVAALVVVFGPLLGQVPIHLLQGIIGVLLLLFGLRWLRKSVLRAAGHIALHDEDKAFADETEVLGGLARFQPSRADFAAGAAAFKAVALEGLEVAFIVIAVGAGRGLIIPASFGALLACALVAILGAAARQPLSKVPENELKFAVGVLLSAFGVFWTTEALGGSWPGGDAFLLVLFAGFGLVGMALRQALAIDRRAATA